MALFNAFLDCLVSLQCFSADSPLNNLCSTITSSQLQKNVSQTKRRKEEEKKGNVLRLENKTPFGRVVSQAHTPLALVTGWRTVSDFCLFFLVFRVRENRSRDIFTRCRGHATGLYHRKTDTSDLGWFQHRRRCHHLPLIPSPRYIRYTTNISSSNDLELSQPRHCFQHSCGVSSNTPTAPFLSHQGVGHTACHTRMIRTGRSYPPHQADLSGERKFGKGMILPS